MVYLGGGGGGGATYSFYWVVHKLGKYNIHERPQYIYNIPDVARVLLAAHYRLVI